MDIFKILGVVAVEGVDAAQSALGGLGKAATVAGKAIAAGLAAGTAAMAGLTMKALNATGELEQNMGGSEAVFANYAKKMQETANTAFSSMGLSASDFLATANKMGALFQGAGFGIEESANISAQAMQRAADVASIMGIDVSAAMEAVAGAAKGNFTMMDNLGVAINETNLQQYALEQGIKKTTAQMTTQEKVGLAMQMFLEKTEYATGNYAKENETLAGSLNTAKAAFFNFLSGVGNAEALAGAFVNAADVIIDNLMTILPKLITGIQGLISNILPKLPSMLQTLLPGIVQGAVALVAGLVAMLPEILSTLIDAIPELMESIKEIIFEQFQDLEEKFESAMLFITETFTPVIDAFRLVKESLQPVIDKVKEYFASGQAAADVTEVFKIVLMVVAGALQAVAIFVRDFIDVTLWLIETIKSAVEACIDFATSIPERFEEFKERIETTITTLVSKALALWESLRSGYAEKVENIKTTVQEKFQNIKDTIEEKITGAKDKVSEIFTNIKDTIEEKINFARDKVEEAIEKIKGFFDFEWKLPDIKLPHFKKTGETSLGLPIIGVEWYAKGGVLNQPTVFGMNPATGSAMVGGEAGAEAVAPIDVLQGYVAEAVASQNTGIAEALDRVASILSDIRESIGEDLKNQLETTSLSINNREFGRLVRSVV